MIDRVDSRKFNYDKGRKTLENEVVVFTGRGFTVRWELAQFARNCRAKVESTVTSRTTLLIVGEKPGGKLIKAKKMGCKIISCDDFYNILMGKDKENDITLNLRNEFDCENKNYFLMHMIQKAWTDVKSSPFESNITEEDIFRFLL